MPNLRNWITGGHKSHNNNNKSTNSTEGVLETDALPVDDEEFSSSSGSSRPLYTISNTPTASSDLTESVVRELSDPNYNSVEVANPSNMSVDIVNGAVDNAMNSTPANNTMNVTNAQQLMMQFNNASNLHFGSVYNINSNMSTSKGASTAESTAFESGGSVGRRQGPKKTVSIVAMMQSQQELTHQMLDVVSTHLGEGWKQVMRDLGLSNGQIEQAIIDHQMHGGVKEVIYQCLLQWQRNAEDGVATLGNLTTRLWETQQRDVVQRMKLIWKSQSNRKTSL